MFLTDQTHDIDHRKCNIWQNGFFLSDNLKWKCQDSWWFRSNLSFWYIFCQNILVHSFSFCQNLSEAATKGFQVWGRSLKYFFLAPQHLIQQFIFVRILKDVQACWNFRMHKWGIGFHYHRMIDSYVLVYRTIPCQETFKSLEDESQLSSTAISLLTALRDCPAIKQ